MKEMLRKKLKAFTLVELMVALVISGIVISIAGLAYMIIFREFAKYKRDNVQVTSAMRLNMMLDNDFSSARTIVYKRKKLTVNTLKGQRKIYTFDSSDIIYQQKGLRDTFFLHPGNINVSFMKDSTKSGMDSLVNGLDFEIPIEGNKEKFGYKKTYDLATKINTLLSDERH